MCSNIKVRQAFYPLTAQDAGHPNITGSNLLHFSPLSALHKAIEIARN